MTAPVRHEANYDLTGLTSRNVTFLRKRDDRKHHLRLYDVRCNLCGHECTAKGPTVLYKTRTRNVDWCPRCKDKRLSSRLTAAGIQRRIDLTARWVAGETLQAIATEQGVSRQRICQLILGGFDAAEINRRFDALTREQLLDAVRRTGVGNVKRIVFIAMTQERGTHDENPAITPDRVDDDAAAVRDHEARRQVA